MRKILQFSFLAFVVAFFSLFLLLPIGITIAAGCRWSLFYEIVKNPVYVEGLWNGLKIAMVTTAIVFCFSTFLAILYDRYDFPGKNVCNILLLAPMVLPPFVGALGFQRILGYYGVINSLLVNCGLNRVDFFGNEGKFWAICVIEALHLYPIFYLNILASLGNIDPSYADAAANMGANRWQRFIHVRLPLLRSGILAGGSLVFIWSFTELGTPLMFGYTRTTAVQIFNGLLELESNLVPYTLVLITLITSLIFYLMAKFALGKHDVSGNKGSMGSSAKKLCGFTAYLPLMAFLFVTLLAILPHVALLLESFGETWYNSALPNGFTLAHFEEALGSSLVLPSIVNSLRYAIIATIIATVIGVGCGLISVRWHLKCAVLVDLLAMLPLAVPGVVVAFGFLGMSIKFDGASRCFNPIENPIWLLSIAYAVRRIPCVVRSVVAGLEQTPEELENAARNFGATPTKTMIKITMPLVAANLIVGALFAFSFSLLEVSDSLILAQKAKFFPITRALYDLARKLGSGTVIACAFGTWTMIFLAITIASAGILLGKRIGTIFKL